MEKAQEEISQSEGDQRIIKDLIMLGIMLSLVFIFPLCLITSLRYILQPVILESVTLNGMTETWVPFRYPTEKFPRFCLSQKLMGGFQVDGLLSVRKMENGLGLWIQVPENQTHYEVIYQCNSIYNASVIVTIIPTNTKVKEGLKPMEIGFLLLFGCLIWGVICYGLFVSVSTMKIPGHRQKRSGYYDKIM